jgi:hypothetical protein
MIMRDNHGNVIAEQSVILREDGGFVTTNTMYDNGRTVAQTISAADLKGNLRSETVLNGKLLP